MVSLASSPFLLLWRRGAFPPARPFRAGPRSWIRSATPARRRLSVDPALRRLGVAAPLHLDRGRRLMDVAHVGLAQFDGRRAEVLLDAPQFRGPRNRDNPGLLRKQPGERD